MYRFRFAPLLVATLITLSWIGSAHGETTPPPIGDCVGRDEELRLQVQTLARQMMLQQMAVEEKARSDGDSGLKTMRLGQDGSRPYYSTSHLSYSVAAIHDHTDHAYTVGMGELQAVLNGVEFRTRHNDYTINQPSSTSNEYHAVDRIPFPDVPPEVTNKGTVTEQIEEMQKWFKAWYDEDDSVRDYKQYFKPILCYMEGAWTSSSGDIDEPFESDRHFLDASTWFELQEKVRYTAYTGSKDNGENLAYLPTTIIGFNETTGSPIFAQWNFRIVCHPVTQHIPRSYFKPAGEFHRRFSRGISVEDYDRTRAARYVLSRFSSDRSHRWDLLDMLMKEIPGKDNYGADLRDNTFDLGTNDVFNSNQPLNSAYYHRWYLISEDGAMGSNIGHRGFNDRNLWVAENTRPEVAGVGFRYCRSDDDCDYLYKRMSYAFPLEIIYLTPLHSWNPYNIEYKGAHNTDEGRTVSQGGRNGGFTQSTAYDGTNSKIYYRTPSAFFDDGEVNSDSADTLDSFTGVLDSSGNIRNVTASGIRIHLPKIPGIDGNVRIRYPIMPVSGEGNMMWKELEALRALIMDMPRHRDMFEVDPFEGIDGGSGGGGSEEQKYNLYMTTTTQTPPGAHTHYVELLQSEVDAIQGGQTVTMTTNVGQGHAHVIAISYQGDAFQYDTCDGSPLCWDGHANGLTLHTAE